MPSLFPSASALCATFGATSPYIRDSIQLPTKRSPHQARTELYPSWDISEEAKQKSVQLSSAAKEELRKASTAAQKNVGKIELYSAKYYATYAL